MRNRMHQSAIVLVRCVPVSFSFRRHIGEDPGDEVESLQEDGFGRVVEFRIPRARSQCKVFVKSKPVPWPNSATPSDQQYDNREFKQIATAGATTAAMTEKVWGEYVASVCQILQSEIQRCQEHELRSSKSLLFCFL